MILALATLDYVVLLFYLAVMVVIGAYFCRRQRDSEDFFLAGRSMGWFPIGLSVMATLVSALSYTGIPGEAYYVGTRWLLLPLAVWLTVPVMMWVVLPLYHRLGMYSVYEYLEMRFDSTVRMVGSAAFVGWRLLWLGGVLYAPCKVLEVAAGIDVPLWMLLVVLGLVATAYTFLGGMKAVLWTDVVQTLVMAAGIVVVVAAVWWNLDGGATRVWTVAEKLGRTRPLDLDFSWTERWSVWAMLPHFFLAQIGFLIADQITVQRFLTGRDLFQLRRSFLLNCVSVTLMIPALLYVGLCLLAYYHDHPQEMRPIWVANVDNTEGLRTSCVDPATGEPLIAWTDGAALDDGNLDPARFDRLVAEGRVLRPNTKEPFPADARLVDPRTDQLDVERLAMRYPRKEGLSRGEVVLHKNAKDELMPRFITERLPAGVAGLILAALFAASMSSFDSGINSIGTLLVADFHRRLGWGRKWLAARVGKPVDELTGQDELRLGRPLVLAVGLAATAFSLAVAQIADIFAVMVALVNTFGGPLLGVFVLGIFTRRTTAEGALAGLIGGTLVTLYLTVANGYDAAAWLWPLEWKLDGVWPLGFGVAATIAIGLVTSLVTGRRKPKDELRGLVVGIGTLGERRPIEEANLVLPEFDLPEIDLPGDGPPGVDRG